MSDREKKESTVLIPSGRVIKEIRGLDDGRREVVPVGISRKAIEEIEKNIAGVALDTLQNETGKKYRLMIKLAFEYNERRLKEAAEKVNARMGRAEKIEIGEVRRPIVHVIPQDQRYRLRVPSELFPIDKTGDVGYFLGEEDMAMVGSGGDFEKDAQNTSHELSHALSRYWMRFWRTYQTGNKPSFLSSWSGINYHFWRGKYHSRGTLFEEALAVEMECGFMSSDVLKSGFPGLVENTKKRHRPNLAGAVSQSQVEAEYGEQGEYAMYWKIVDRMVRGIERIEGEKTCTWELLVLGRIEPKLLKGVRDQCDRVYGKGTFQRMWRLGDKKGDSLERMMEWLDLGRVKESKGRGPEIKGSMVDQMAGEISPNSRIGRQIITNNTRRVWNRMLVTPEANLSVDFVRRLLKIAEIDYWLRGREAEFFARDLLATNRHKTDGGVIGAFDMGTDDKQEDWLTHRVLPGVEGCLSVKEVSLAGASEKEWCVRSNFREKAGDLADILSQLEKTGLAVRPIKIRVRGDGDAYLFCESPGEEWQRFDQIKSGFNVSQLLDLAVFMGDLATEMGNMNRFMFSRNEAHEFFVGLDANRLQAKAFDLSRTQLAENKDVRSAKHIECRNMEWLLKNFFWALIGNELGHIQDKKRTDSWDQLGYDYDDPDPEMVMDKILTHMSEGRLAGVKARLMKKLGDDGGNSGKRYSGLGLIFREARFAIKRLDKDNAPDSDWMASASDLAKRLSECLS